MSEKIIEVDYETEMGQSYLDYAMSVIIERALPDLKDGLKPVQRRILYSLSSLAKSDSPHRKCARIVGDTMGKYHPHGDSSIYEGLVNMAQDFKLPIPLVDPHGNFGSIDGDGASAMRYTEARISKYTENVCIKDLPFFKDQFVDNFDNTESEPTFLPFQVPNILVSGTSGIAVGMATNIPTHNLGEVIDATIKYLQNNDCTIDDIMEVMPAPDFATGGIINVSKEQMKSIYSTGLGKLKIRGKVEVRDGGYGRKTICVTELPYTMIGGTSKFLYTVAELVKKRELPAVVDIADRGDKNGVCLCIDVKKGTSDSEIDNIINILYKKAGLENTFGVNLRVINDKKPVVMGVLDVLREYCKFKYEIYNTKYSKLLTQQLEVKEVKEGLLRAVDCIDLIIAILRGSKSVSDAKDCLINGNIKPIKFKSQKYKEEAKTLNFTEKQADAILSMRLQKLIGLEIDALKKELSNVEKNISEYQNLIDSKENMTNQMIKDLKDIKKEFSIPRKSLIKDLGEIKIEKAKESAVEVAILIDRFSYAKVIEKSVYDKNEASIIKDYRKVILCNNTDRFCIFTDKNAFKVIKVMDIIKAQNKKNVSKKNEGGLFGKLSDKGTSILTAMSLEEDENIIYYGIVEQLIKNDVVFVTKDGLAKIVDGNVFDTTRKSTTAYKDSESVIYVGECIESDIAIKSNNGYFFRFPLSVISKKGKGAGCSKLLSLSKGDFITEVKVGSTKDNFTDKEIPFTKIKLINKGNKGVKMRV